jgi:hypothetical protein
MIKTAQINERLLKDLPVIRLPKFVLPGPGLSIWWMADDRITFHVVSEGAGFPAAAGAARSR